MPEYILFWYIDGYIWCFGGTIATLHILDPSTDEIWSFEHGLETKVNYHSTIMYNIPVQSNVPAEAIVFVLGGQNSANNYVDIIQYMALEYVPTPSPTTDPTIDPTSDPTTDPTIEPTTIPTTEPTMQPSQSPTLPRKQEFLTFLVESDMDYVDMVDQNYQINIIKKVEQTLERATPYNTDQITMRYQVVSKCGDQNSTISDWKYSIEAPFFNYSEFEDYLDSDEAVVDIEKAVQNITKQKIAVTAVLLEDEFVNECNRTILTDKEETAEEAGIFDFEFDLTKFESISLLVFAAVIILPILVLLVAAIAHELTKPYKGSDRPKYMALFKFFTNVGDFWSDILFAFHLLSVGSGYFLFAALFTFVPYLFGIILLVVFILKVRGSKKSYAYITIANYLHSNDYVLIGLALVGGLFPALQICSSHLFHLSIFSMEFRENQLQQMQYFRFFNIALFENAPQLVIQLLFAITNNGEPFTDPTTVIAMFFSMLSLMMGCLKTISNVSENRGLKKNKQVRTRLSVWLHTDTHLGTDQVGEDEMIAAIKKNPRLLFRVTLKSQDFTHHHRYTKKILTSVFANTLSIDKAAIELFGFDMLNKHQLDFFAEISLVKLMKFQVFTEQTKYSEIKQAMLDTADKNKNEETVELMHKKMKLPKRGSGEVVEIYVNYLGTIRDNPNDPGMELMTMPSAKHVMAVSRSASADERDETGFDVAETDGIAKGSVHSPYSVDQSDDDGAIKEEIPDNEHAGDGPSERHMTIPNSPNAMEQVASIESVEPSEREEVAEKEQEQMKGNNNESAVEANDNDKNVEIVAVDTLYEYYYEDVDGDGDQEYYEE